MYDVSVWSQVKLSLKVLGFLNGSAVFSVLLRFGTSSLGDGHLKFRGRGVVLSSGVELFTDSSILKLVTIRLCRNTEHQSPQWNSGGYKKNGDL